MRLLRLFGIAFGIIGGILLVLLAIGLLLPSRWTAEEDVALPAPPEVVHRHLASAEAWDAWTPSPESGYEYFGPDLGRGSGRRWDDPGYGRGEFVVTRSEAPGLVEYEVQVEDGAIVIRGRLEVEPEGTGSRVRWREEGDFGWNPLLGYLAGRMEELQAEQLAASLEALREVLAGQATDSPGSSAAAPRSSSSVASPRGARSSRPPTPLR